MIQVAVIVVLQNLFLGQPDDRDHSGPTEHTARSVTGNRGLSRSLKNAAFAFLSAKLVRPSQVL